MFAREKQTPLKTPIYTVALLGLLSFFTACSQVPPPNPDPFQGWQGKKIVNGVVVSGPSTQSTELPFKVFAGPAQTLYQYMRVNKAPGEKPGTFVKQGKDYSCTDLGKGDFECALTFDLTTGAIKNHHDDIDVADQFEVVPVNYGMTHPDDHTLDDLLIITAKTLPSAPANPSQGNYFDLKQDNGKLVYTSLLVPVSPAFDPKNDWKVINGKQVNCINPSDGNYSCRIFMDWETGEIKSIGAAPNPDPLQGWQGTKLPYANPAPLPELLFKIFGNSAKVLFDYMEVIKEAGEKSGTFVKQGKDYRCSDLPTGYECAFTFDERDGSVKNHIENIKMATEFDTVPVNVGVTHPENHNLDDFLILTVTPDAKDPSRDNHYDITAGDGLMVYDALQVKVLPPPSDAKLQDWKVKNGKQVNCVIRPTFGYDCRIMLDWKTGSILPIDPPQASTATP